jgi:uncharacterized RDD family membrane protein YckC
MLSRRVTAVKHNPQTVTIETPDHVELQFLLAGIGTRFLAYLVDRAIQVGLIAWLIVTVLVVLMAIGSVETIADILARARGTLGQWLIALAILVYGLISIGYFMIFEYAWSGSTPGKRSQHIRVIRNDGRPVSFVDAALRNILRFVDIVADVYPVGLAFMFLDSRNRRLGDLAAGTLVIVEKRDAQPPVPRPLSEPGEFDPEIRRIVTYMTPEDAYLIAKFLSRRSGLEEASRRAVTEAICDRISRKTGLQFDPTSDRENVLEELETVYRERVRIL